MAVMMARRRTGSKLLSRSEGANSVSSLQQFNDVIDSSLGCRISRNDENDVCFGNLIRENDRAFPLMSDSIDEDESVGLLFAVSPAHSVTMNDVGDFTDIT